jgi:hypothetical protein
MVPSSFEASATCPFADATNSTEAHITEHQIFQDGTAYLRYVNGTGLDFLRNFLGPVYLNTNNTIYYKNGTVAFR